MKIRKRQKIRELLRTDPEARQIVARMARSEVKNYLAQLAEEAEIPFASPTKFLALVMKYARGTTSLDELHPPKDGGEGGKF